MAALVCAVLMLAMVGVTEGAWCVCRPDVADSSLQKALDYACGAGADCTSLHQGGACYNPNTVRAHCSYAANSYFQRKGQSQQACDFAGAATLSPQDPSSNGCTFPASPSAAGTSGTNTNTNTPPSTNSPGSTTTTIPGSTTPTTTSPGSTTPNTFTPNTGTGTGGVLGGSLGPSISSTDSSDGVPTALRTTMPSDLLLLSSLLIMFNN